MVRDNMRLATVQKRNAFTLVELLVVIAIIVILMALTVGVISKVYVYLDEVKVNTEVNRMAQACEQFKATFGRYPPSKIILSQVVDPGLPAPPPAGSYRALMLAPATATLAQISAEYLSSIFPGINLNLGHQWAGGSPMPGGYVILEGQQCLTFFLGGMRYPGSAHVGFNTDKTNPTANSTSTRLGPFFEFEPSRIEPGLTFPAYKDVYGSAYLYFASTAPGMNNYRNRFFPAPLSVPNDCETIANYAGTLSFVPYFVGTVPTVPQGSWGLLVGAPPFKFHKSDTYQIISAGKDKLYGTGGQWNQTDPEQSAFLPPAVASAAPYSISLTPAQWQEALQANYDNITNFAGGRVVPK